MRIPLRGNDETKNSKETERKKERKGHIHQCNRVIKDYPGRGANEGKGKGKEIGNRSRLSLSRNASQYMRPHGTARHVTARAVYSPQSHVCLSVCLSVPAARTALTYTTREKPKKNAPACAVPLATCLRNPSV